jgi:hypothetical protein
MPVRRDDNAGKVERGTERGGRGKGREGEGNAEAGERKAVRAKAKAKTEWGHWGVQKGWKQKWQVNIWFGKIFTSTSKWDSWSNTTISQTSNRCPAFLQRNPGESPQPRNGRGEV